MTEFEALAVKVRRLQTAQYMSQSELAQAVGVSTAAIRRVEEGIPGQRFGVVQLHWLAQVFHCSVSELFRT